MSRKFEVQTFTLLDGWTNCWTDTTEEEGFDANGSYVTEWVERPALFSSREEAEAAIHEFFADLGRAGMAQSYSIEDYRVVELTNAAPEETISP